MIIKRKRLKANPQTKKKKYSIGELIVAECLTIFLIYLQFIDFIFTITGLHKYGIEIEGNPIVKELVKFLGIDLGVSLVKIIAIVVLFLTFNYLYLIYTRRLLIFLIMLNLLYLFAAYTWIVLLFLK